MSDTLTRGLLLKDILVRTPDGRDVYVSDFRSRRNVVLIFPGDRRDVATTIIEQLAHNPTLAEEEAVLLVASSADARRLYDAPMSALFISDRYGEIFFSVRHPDPLPDADEVLKWLEFINHQCPE